VTRARTISENVMNTVMFIQQFLVLMRRIALEVRQNSGSRFVRCAKRSESHSRANNSDNGSAQFVSQGFDRSHSDWKVENLEFAEINE